MMWFRSCSAVLALSALFTIFSSEQGLGADAFQMALEDYRSRSFGSAASRFEKIIDGDPTHKRAYHYLALCYEELYRWEDALNVWKDYHALATNDPERAVAVQHIAKCRANLDKVGMAVAAEKVFSETLPYEITVQTAHFTVRAKNKAVAELVGHKAELYLKKLCAAIMGPVEFPRKLPILIFTDKQEFDANVGTAGASGITQSHTRWGTPKRVCLYYLDTDGGFERNVIDITLPHELTHAVLAEHFGQMDLSLWLNEGIAQAMEAGGRGYRKELLQELSRRDDLYPLRHLFSITKYPPDPDKGKFYRQSEAMVLFLMETLGAEGMQKFMRLLRQGMPQEVALARAMGFMYYASFPDKLEVQWRNWLMRRCEGETENK